MHQKYFKNANQVLPDRRKRRRWKVYDLLQRGSIFQWTLAIFFVVTLPLIVTIQYSVLNIDEYADQGAGLFLTIGASNNSQVLGDQLLDIDRSIREYQVLEDPDIFAVYQEHHQKFTNVVMDTNFYELPDKLQQLFIKITRGEVELYNQILIIKNQENKKLSIDDIKGYSQLRSDARKLVAQLGKQVTREITSLSELATLVRKKVIQAALVSVILAFFLGLLLLYLINMPIRRIERSIRKLGNAQESKRIYIEGPRDLRKVGEHLEWLRQKLNQLENNKQFFIKTISHELKTPLATMVEGTDLLQDEVVGELNSEQHKILELLQIANLSLSDLIENLLEYQKVKSTLAKMYYSQFNLNLLVDNICSDYQLLLNKKNISVDLDGISIDLKADRDKLRIIISNVFSNALKFSPDGGQININIRVVDERLHMLIADQGPGIAKDQLPHIFTEFSRQEEPGDWKIKGSGLGLNLVKEYVGTHHGKIKVLESTIEYCGAHFLIILPLEPK